MPNGARIHLGFHVSLLKRKIRVADSIEPILAELDSHDQSLLKPENMVKRRVILCNAQPVIQYSIKWSICLKMNHRGITKLS